MNLDKRIKDWTRKELEVKVFDLHNENIKIYSKLEELDRELKKQLLIHTVSNRFDEKDQDFGDWVNNNFDSVGKLFKNKKNGTVYYTQNDLVIIYEYLIDRHIANGC